MKAAVRDRYGPPDLVEITDVERPVPAPDQAAAIDDLIPALSAVRGA